MLHCINCGEVLDKTVITENVRVKFSSAQLADIVYVCRRCGASFSVEECKTDEASFRIRKLSANETIRILGMKYLFPLINAGAGLREHYLVVTDEIFNNGSTDEIGLLFTQSDFFNLLKATTTNYAINRDFEDEIAEPSNTSFLSLNSPIYVTRLPRELATYNGVINHLFSNAKIIIKK